LLDRERLLAKIDILDRYLKELREILPGSFEEYKKIEKRRACERLLQVSIECIIDICGLIVIGLRLGLPAEEDDLFEKLEQAGIITSSRKESLKQMKGFRNILVHEYGHVDDRIVYEILQNHLNDFDTFKQEILQAIQVK
jgi:uncharacterized protein YutE (UPF0331/DUF86 family)